VFVFLQATPPGDPVNELLQYLTRGFDKDPGELVALTVFLGLIVALILVSIIFSRRRNRKAIGAARKRLEGIIADRQLSGDERDAVMKLARFFRRKKRYVDEVVTLPASFTAAARRLLAKKPAYDEMIARLRLKLGLSAKGSGQMIHSTAELIAGMPLLVHSAGTKTVRGNVLGVDATGVTVKTDAPPSRGSPVMLELRTRQGCFIIISRIIDSEGDRISIAHTEKVEHSQKRAFFRKRLKLPVTVQTGNGADPEEGFIMDLSAGGARVLVSGLSLEPRQEISLTFSPDKKKPLKLHSRVIRLVEKDNSASVVFTDITKPVEDRIMRLVLK